MYDDTDTERWRPEPAKATGLPRSPFERDRARVLHSVALRRLAAKTQVVGVGQDDFPRTRLTHSLECAQIGRELGASLGCDPDVVEAACLAHDLGHPPFGHTGEYVLDEAAATCGGFEGNAQSLRVLTRLEAKIAGAGLNLTRAVLDAATKYPWPRHDGEVKYGVYPDDRPVFDWARTGAPAETRCLEAQVMDWADDIAYSVHDLEDGLHARHIPADRLDAEAVVELAASSYSSHDPSALHAVLAGLVAEPWWVRRYDGSAGDQVALKRMTSELIGRFCAAAYTATRAAFGDEPLHRYAAGLVVPEQARAECALLKAVTVHYVMGRPDSLAERERQRSIVAELVAALLRRAPEALDPSLAEAWHRATDDSARLRVVIDQVASLTDTSAFAWHARLGAR